MKSFTVSLVSFLLMVLVASVSMKTMVACVSESGFSSVSSLSDGPPEYHKTENPEFHVRVALWNPQYNHYIIEFTNDNFKDDIQHISGCIGDGCTNYYEILYSKAEAIKQAKKYTSYDHCILNNQHAYDRYIHSSKDTLIY